MSDLTATNCGCGCETASNGGNNCLWIILLLACCGGCGGSGFSGFGGCGDNSCLWIILLLIFCGGCGNTFNYGGYKKKKRKHLKT